MFWRKKKKYEIPETTPVGLVKEWEAYRRAAITTLEHCADKLDPDLLRKIALLHLVEAIGFCADKLSDATRIEVALKCPVQAVRCFADKLDPITLDICKRRYAEMQAELQQDLELQIKAIEALALKKK